MLVKTHQKIDIFYLIMAALSVVLAAILIVTFKSIFSAIITAYETDSSQSGELRINKDKIEEANNKYFLKEYSRLKL